MLNKVNVKGFRSLRDFELYIKPGLNVLVGPNGAGKTNIILFFDFLNNLTSTSLANSIGQAGGIAQVFAKRGKSSFSNNIEILLTGQVEHDREVYPYKLRLELNFSQSRQDVVFSAQEFKVDRISKRGGKPARYLNVIYRPDAGERSGIEFISFPDSDARWVKGEISRLDKAGYFSNACISSFIIHSTEVLALVGRDFSGRFVLNVVPSHVKKVEDSTRQPGIESDGSGLSATLYAIRKKRPFSPRALRFPFHTPAFEPPDWDEVMGMIQVAVPSIEDIDVENDPFDNLLRCRITVGKGSRSAVVPLNAMSDGTVKWMSLVARLLTSREALLLEEPENYLHPLMQREIVRLLRASVTDSSFMMMSTHSETLLNAVRPDELVVVSYEKGGTVAKRVSNAGQVESEINRTGFGLGYYYLADAVES